MAVRKRCAVTTGFEMGETILHALAVHGGMTAVELGGTIDVDPATVDRVCYRLQRGDAVRVVDGERYLLTQRGEYHLADRRSMPATNRVSQ